MPGDRGHPFYHTLVATKNGVSCIDLHMGCRCVAVCPIPQPFRTETLLQYDKYESIDDKKGTLIY